MMLFYLHHNKEIVYTDCGVPRLRTGPTHWWLSRRGRGVPQHHEDGGGDEYTLHAAPLLTQGRMIKSK